MQVGIGYRGDAETGLCDIVQMRAHVCQIGERHFRCEGRWPRKLDGIKS